MAEQSRVLSQIQKERMPEVPGLNPARDYDIDRSELKITCHYLIQYICQAQTSSL